MESTTPPNATCPLPRSTPIKTATATTLPFTTNQKYRFDSITAMAEEISKYLVGPMPAQQFLNEFFPSSEDSGISEGPHFKPGCYSRTVKATNEKQAYAPFVEETEKFTPGLEIVNSSSFPDCNPRSSFLYKIKPDISVYPAYPKANGKTDSTMCEIFIEFKWHATDDPFCDVRRIKCPHCDIGDVNSFLRDSKTAKDTLGQITSYAAAQLSAQFRTHVYSVFILQDTARILRWDRSGTIVTEAIKYNEVPHLVEFFRRFSRAPPEMRGRDESVSTPMPEEESAARAALGLDQTHPFVKVSIPDADGSPLYFVIPTPEAIPYTPPGRATRGSKAYDISRGAVVYLKDTWRIDVPGIQAEGRVYRTLKEANVRHVPHCLASGDISIDDYHTTKTHLYTWEPWACHADAHFIPHRHYRLVLDIVGRVLVQYRSSYEMTSAVRDSLLAHMDAYNAGILHRDFSVGNIVISDGKGWLIDWDLSKPVAQGPEIPRRATRTGTWQFMSAALISGISLQHHFNDDLESSIYVLLWLILTHSEVSSPDQVPTFLATVLDPRPFASMGGYGKADFLKGRTFLERVQFPHRPALHKLVDQLAQLFAVRYEQELVSADQMEQWRQTMESQPELESLFHASAPFLYFDRKSKLGDHNFTIKLFDEALSDPSKWPTDDAPVKQFISPTRAPMTKTGWSSTLYAGGLDTKSGVSKDSDDFSFL